MSWDYILDLSSLYKINSSVNYEQLGFLRRSVLHGLYTFWDRERSSVSLISHYYSMLVKHITWILFYILSDGFMSSTIEWLVTRWQRLIWWAICYGSLTKARQLILMRLLDLYNWIWWNFHYQSPVICSFCIKSWSFCYGSPSACVISMKMLG